MTAMEKHATGMTAAEPHATIARAGEDGVHTCASAMGPAAGSTTATLIQSTHHHKKDRERELL